MKVIDQVKNSFNEMDMEELFTREEIVERVVLKFSTNNSSVIPSDYCYNRTNNDIQKRFKTQLHIFEYLGKSKYKYLGENYPYEGNIYHSAKGEIEQIVGKWIDNEPVFLKKPLLDTNSAKIMVKKPLLDTNSAKTMVKKRWWAQILRKLWNRLCDSVK